MLTEILQQALKYQMWIVNDPEYMRKKEEESLPEKKERKIALDK